MYSLERLSMTKKGRKDMEECSMLLNRFLCILGFQPYRKCLQKCVKVRTCASVDFVDNKCIINDYQCSDDELDEAGPTDMNFMRLENGVNKCPANRARKCKLQPRSCNFQTINDIVFTITSPMNN